MNGKIEEALKNISHNRLNLVAISQEVIPAKWGQHFCTGFPSAFIFAFRGGWSNTESIKDSVRSVIKNGRINPPCLFDLPYVQEEVHLSWVYRFERERFVVRPCDNWHSLLYFTEITTDDYEVLALY